MTFPNINAAGSAAGQQAGDPAAMIGDNIAGAVGGVANRMGVDPQQLGDVVTGIMEAASNGDQQMLGAAIGAMAELLSQGGQAQGGGGGAPAGGAPAAPAGGGGAGPSQSAGGGGQNPLDLLAALLSALGVPPEMIEKIVNAVVQNAQQSQGGGGADQAGSAVPGVMAS